MAVDLNKLIALLTKSLEIGAKIEAEIRKETNAKKRKKLFMAADKHDLDAIRDLLFD